MQTYRIHALRTRYVVPIEFKTDFDYKETLDAAIDKLASSGWEPASPYREGETDVFHHLIHEFDGQPKEKINFNNMGFFLYNRRLAESPLEFIVIAKDRNKQDFRVSLKEAGLYIFRTGIGLLWYEVGINPIKESGKGYQDDEAHPLDSEMLHDFQYSFREMRQELKGYHVYEAGEKKQDKNKETIYFKSGNETYMRAWLENTIGQIGASFLASRDNEEGFVPDKALIFTHALFDPAKEPLKEDKNAMQTAFYLTNGYKTSAHISPDYVNNIVFPFSYSVWSATKEGCGFFVWRTGEGEESNFDYFRSEKHQIKVINDYFAMYIRALYVSYSLYRFAMLIAADDDIVSYYEAFNDPAQVDKIYQEIRYIDLNINIFLAKSMVTSVSHIHHQNDFYSYLIDRLRVKQDIKSVTSGLDALKDLSANTISEKKRQQEEEAQEKEKESDNRFQAGLGILSLLSVFSAIADAVAVALYMDSFAKAMNSGNWFTAGNIAGMFFILVCLFLFVMSLAISGKMIVQFLFKRKPKDGRD